MSIADFGVTTTRVSGGLDSVLLLDVLHRLGVPVAVAHCHFGLRGEEADADPGAVGILARAQPSRFRRVSMPGAKAGSFQAPT